MSAERVLIVDNDKNVMNIIKSELESKGVEVVLASDGAEALDILSDRPIFDAIVTNLSMPMVSGLELCRKVADIYPTVVITGDIEEGFKDKITTFCDTCVQKSDVKDFIYKATLKAKERFELNTSAIVA